MDRDSQMEPSDREEHPSSGTGWIGEQLKEQRKEKGLTKKEICERTKISLKYVDAIEEGALEIMPDTVYCIGFLKAYAREIGYDPDAIAKQYREYMGREEQKTTRLLEQDTRERLPFMKKLKPLHFILFAGLFLFLMVAVFGIIHGEQDARMLRGFLDRVQVQEEEPTAPHLDDRDTVSDADDQGFEELHGYETFFRTLDDEASGEDETGAGEELLGTFDPADGEQEPAEEPEPMQDEADEQDIADNDIPQPESLLLEVEITAQSWLRVIADNQTVFEGTLEEGATREWEADEEFHLRTGNAGGVQLFLNGQPLGSMGNMGQVLERTLTLDD